jgi:hypothetical protein
MLFWNRIMYKLMDLLETWSSNLPEDYVAHDGLMREKTENRIQGLKPDVRVHAEEMLKWVRDQNVRQCPAVLHGDLCFSNILYDRRSDQLKVIDPRGKHYINGVRGNQLYDIAKLYHSARGKYDFAVAGRACNEDTGRHLNAMACHIEDYLHAKWGINSTVLIAVTGLLFYSMLPLHADDMGRVARLLNSAEALYFTWKARANG